MRSLPSTRSEAGVPVGSVSPAVFFLRLAYRSITAGAALSMLSIACVAPPSVASQSIPPATFASKALSKLDPFAQAALAELRAGASAQSLAKRGIAVKDERTLEVFIEGEVTREELEAAGAVVHVALSGIFTASIPVGAVERVVGLPGVSSIHGAALAHPVLDTSVPTTGADVLRGPGPAFTGINGEGVLIGVVDTGIDFEHGDFDDPAGNTRIVTIWDQTISGTPPAGFAFGHECTQADIQSGTCPQVDVELAGHGTTIAGIAAGDGSQGGGGISPHRFVGMAPKADIAVVKTTNAITDIVNGVYYLFQLAEARGQNCVVNLSLSSHAGAHDGTSLFDRSMDLLSGPGRIVVAGAGNNRELAHKAEIFADGSGNGNVATLVVHPPFSYPFFELVGTYESTEELTIEVTTPRGVVFTVPLGTCYCPPGIYTADGTVIITNFSLTTGGDHFNVIRVHREDGSQDLTGTWTIKAIPEALGAARGEVDLWLSYPFQDPAFEFTVGSDSNEKIGEPATALETITVAAWATRNEWTGCNGVLVSRPEDVIGDIALFSSPGPTRDGRQKPDITAPGVHVIAALTKDIGWVCPAPPGESRMIGTSYREASGTSFATPFVSGAVALMLQKYGALTSSQVKAYLFDHALTDGFTGTAWNEDWGQGKLFLGALADPVVRLLTPNGGESLRAGSLATITWTAAEDLGGVTGIDLDVSRDGGTTWERIATGIANSGTFDWRVTGPHTTSARIRVSARYGEANPVRDASDAALAITVGVSIADARVVEGNSGTTGIVFQIASSVSLCEPVTVHYQTSNGTATAETNDYVAASGDVTLAPAPPVFDRAWGSEGFDPGEFYNPLGIDVDEAGNVYVAEQLNARVQKFDRDGNHLLEWGSAGTGPGQFMSPWGVAVADDGSVYVVDGNTSRVERFTSSGTFLHEWGSAGTNDGQFTSPSGVAVDHEGFVYVAEFYGHRIQKFTSDGTFVTKWGSEGSGDGQFRHPHGLDVDDAGNVYVADYLNHRIQKFDSNGVHLGQWGSNGSGPGEFILPGDVEVRGGCVYVADIGNNRIQEFALDGAYLAQWGEFGTEEGQFDAPRSLAASASGHVYVPDQNHRIQRFRPVPSDTTISISVVGDLRHERNEELEVVLSNPIHALVERSSGAGLIGNDDPVEVFVYDSGIGEGDAGTSSPPITIQLSGVNHEAVTVGYATADASATDADDDYEPIASGSHTFLVPPPVFQVQWGSPGSGQGQFHIPAHLSLDSQGNVYVADFGNHRIQKFDADGNRLLEWGGNGSANGQFTNPAGIAIDGFDRVYVVEEANARVQRFDASGSFIDTWGRQGAGEGEFSQPSGIAVDGAGNVYVADRYNHRMQKFDSNGRFLMEWGHNGVGDGEFDQPCAVAVDGDVLYVAEMGNHRIQKFTTAGVFIRRWGFNSGGPGHFNFPQAVAVDPSGFVYVADTYNQRLQKFTSSGAYLQQWTTSAGGFPRGLAIDPSGRIYVTDIGNQVVERFGVQAPIASIPVTVNGDTRVETRESFLFMLSSPVNATLGRALSECTIFNDDVEVGIGDGRVAEGDDSTRTLDFVVASRGTICVPTTVDYQSFDGTAIEGSGDYSSIGGSLTLRPGPPAFELTWGSSGSGSGQFNEPFGVAVDASGNVYVADRHNHRVQKFDANGGFLQQWGTGAPSAANGEFNEPYGIAVDGGHVFVADGGNHRIQKLTTDGVFVSKWGSHGSAPGQFDHPFDIAADGTGTVYVADRSNHRVQQFDVNGGFIRMWGGFGTGNGQFKDPIGLTVDGLATVFVADFNNHRVQRFDRDGTFLAAWGTNGSGDGQFNGPFRVAEGPCNTIYVTDRGNDRVQVFEGDGNFLVKWGSSGSGPGQFGGPDGIAIATDGSVYVSDEANHRIQKFHPVDPRATLAVNVNGDGRLEANETLEVQLSNLNIGSLTRSVATGTILDDDVELRVADDRELEGDAGTTSFTFPIDLRGTVCRPITLDYQSIDATALAADGDYVPATSNTTLLPVAPVSEVEWNSGFNGPVGIALDGRGSVYVTDYNNHRVRKFDANGNLLLEWGSFGTDTAQFQRPNGIAVDGFGNVYVTEEDGDRLQKFDANGVFIRQWGSSGAGVGQLESPAGVVVDWNGFVYVADRFNHRIQKFDLDGNFILAWGGFGTDPEFFDQPYGVAVNDQGQVYVVELINSRVQKFDANGTYLTSWAQAGSPTHAAVDACGNVYVSQSAGQVSVFDGNGQNLFDFGTGINAYGVAVDDTGHVYVVNYSSDRVHRFAPVHPTGSLAVDVNGDVSYEANEVFKLVVSNVVNATAVKDTGYASIVNDDPVAALVGDKSRLEGDSGTGLLEFAVSLTGAPCDTVKLGYGTQDGSAEAADDDFEAASGTLELPPLAPEFERKWSTPSGSLPTWIALSGSGRLYVSDQNRGLVLKYEANGTFLASWGGFGSDNGQFQSPAGVTVDRHGYVYVADQSANRIQKFDENGVFLIAWGSSGNGDGRFQNPTGLAVDDSGHVYVADASNNRIQVFDADGRFLRKLGAPGQFGLPIGLSFDDAGYLYVVELANRRVQKVDRDGVTQLQWGTLGSQNGEFDTPNGVAVDGCGHVFVADANLHRVQEFDSEGRYLAQWGAPIGSQDGSLNNPVGLAVDRLDHVFVADAGNTRIQMFAPVAPRDTIPVTVNGDTKIEADETFAFVLTAVENVTLGLGSATGTIVNDDAAPAVTVIAPNGGESFPVSSVQSIRWTATDDDTVISVDIAYSRDGGATFTDIALGEENDGTFAWTVPGPPTAGPTARVRVIARDDQGHTSRDSSDAAFSIIEPNLCRNPGFEENLTGWIKYGSATLTRVTGTSPTVHSGVGALQVRGSSDSDFGIDDSPNWIARVVAKGAVYRFSAWVRLVSGRGEAELNVKEVLGSSTVGSATSIPLRLSSSWQPITLDYTVRTAGTTLSLRILTDPSSSGTTFAVDDVTILLISRPPDRAPVVTAPATASGFAGFPISFKVTSSDPDGEPITRLFVTPLPPSASFVVNGDNTSGTFTWTPTAGDVGSHPLVFTAENGLSGNATTQVNVSPAPPNLCGNGDFETGVQGWSPYNARPLERITGTFPTVHSGSGAMQIRASGSSSFGTDDSPPNWIPTVAGRNAVYRFSAYVRSTTHTGRVRIRLTEILNGNTVGSASSPEISLSSTWRQHLLDYTVRYNGSTISMRITDASGYQTFVVDDVSIQQISNPTLVAGGPAETEPTVAPVDELSNGAETPLVYSASLAPNPVRGEGVLSLTLTRPGFVRAAVFDASGRRVATLLEGDAPAGTHRLTLGGAGRVALDPGLYFYRVESAEGVLRGRFVYVR